MTLNSRLTKLEKQAGGRPPADDPDREAKRVWLAFWAFMQAALQPHTAALAAVRRSVEANFGTWGTPAEPGVKLWLLSNTCWAALKQFPEAERVAQAAWAEVERAAAARGPERGSPLAWTPA